MSEYISNEYDDYGDYGEELEDNGDMDLYQVQEFENEIGFVDRVAFASDVTVDVGGISSFKELEKKILNPAEGFRIRMDAISRNLNENDILKLSQGDITFMSDMIKKIKSPEYINPTGFILGYYITNGGNKINDDNLNLIFQLIKSDITSGGIKEPDVIRYSRYWQNLIK